MDLKRKLELAKQAIVSISQHDDADVAIRNKALDRVQEFIDQERAAAADRLEVKMSNMGLDEAEAG